jgi:hypothetical protein
LPGETLWIYRNLTTLRSRELIKNAKKTCSGF